MSISFKFHKDSSFCYGDIRKKIKDGWSLMIMNFLMPISDASWNKGGVSLEGGWSQVDCLFLLFTAVQCNTNIFKYSNIPIIAAEYYIFEYEYTIFLFRIYTIFLFRIYSIFIFGQVGKNKYIRYSYSVRLGGTNIFDIRIRLVCEERILYLILVFGKIFQVCINMK